MRKRDIIDVTLSDKPSEVTFEQAWHQVSEAVTAKFGPNGWPENYRIRVGRKASLNNGFVGLIVAWPNWVDRVVAFDDAAVVGFFGTLTMAMEEAALMGQQRPWAYSHLPPRRSTKVVE